MEEEKDRLKFTIERYDHYYDSINNKCGVFLALSTFIVGGLIAAYPSFLNKVNANIWVHLSTASLIAIGLGIMILVVRASTPFLMDDKDSLFYFHAVGSQSTGVFSQRSKACSAEEELQDLRIQVHQLASGLTAKFRALRVAGILFTVQFLLFIPALILLITNLK